MLAFHKGVAHWNDQPTYFITAEYPYFRDDPANWEARLRALIEIGVQTVSTYIPWRHHEVLIEGERRCDFEGATLPSRNVLGFVEICRRLGLRVVLKPGPFCHAELNYGGLPDFIRPLNRADITPALTADGQPVTWFFGSEVDATGKPIPWPLPSVHGPAFQAEVAQWFRAVRTQVLLPSCPPDGPLVAIQVGNEGIYSDAQHAVWAHDYSAPAVARIQVWLRDRYGTIDRYNQAHATTLDAWEEIMPPRRFQAPVDLRGLRAYRDWAEFAGAELAELYQTYANLLDLPVPALTNVNPPVAEAWGIDAWLSRVQPEQWGEVRYGYSNWIGIAAADPSALARYMLLTRRAAGPNLEENLGFTAFYGEDYASTSTCFQQTLVAIAGGSTGYNLYTAVASASWTDDLDRFMERPYPSHAPITAAGDITAKARVVARLGAFFRQYGGEFVSCARQTGAAFGLYQPYAYVGAWLDMPTAEVIVAGHRLPQQGPAWLTWQQALLAHGIDLDTVQLQADDDLLRFPTLVVIGGPWMDAATQTKLAQYHRAGRKLVLIGEVPLLDEEMQACTVMVEAGVAGYPDLAAALAALPQLAAPAPPRSVAIVPEDGGYVWIRAHPQRDVHYVIAVNRQTERLSIQYMLNGASYTLDLTLAPGGGALVRVENGAVADSVILDHNDTLNRVVVPECRLERSQGGR